jgi:hypothetical protein
MSKKGKEEGNAKSYFIFFMTDGCDTCNNESAIISAKVKICFKIGRLSFFFWGGGSSEKLTARCLGCSLRWKTQRKSFMKVESKTFVS